MDQKTQKGGINLRIEIDEQLEKMLDEIKRKRWITGKGHTETVRYLAQYHQQYQSIKELIDKKLSDIDKKLEKRILAAFRTVINNIFQKPSS